MQYYKELVYLNRYQSGEKAGSAGLLIIEWKNEALTFHLKVQNITENGNDFDVTIKDDAERLIIRFPVLHMDGNKGILYKRCVESELESLKIFGERKGQVVISLGNNTWIKGIFNPFPFVEQDRENLPIEAKECVSQKDDLSEEIESSDHEKTDGQADLLQENEKETENNKDQWQIYLSKYPNIQPFGDDRMYITLTLSDLKILKEEYQYMANNSFLLHGYYYYKYLILGKEKSCYLGVPGIYHEREKMMALMFGFDAFDCAGGKPVQGTFGYYLKKVALKE